MTHTTPQRSDYRHFQPITTRWHDNDIYGHVNNVTYYSFFDSAVNTYLIAVLKSTPHADLAQEFVDLVTGEAGQKILSQAGFGKP